jgi:hypothetical protein
MPSEGKANREREAAAWVDSLIEGVEEGTGREIPESRWDDLRELISPDIENALDAIHGAVVPHAK